LIFFPDLEVSLMHSKSYVYTRDKETDSSAPALHANTQCKYKSL